MKFEELFIQEPRKIIQITQGPQDTLFGLSDDGIVWYYQAGIGKWTKIPDIPQYEIVQRNDEDAS